MNKKIFTFALAMIALPALSTAAAVYKWTDENGVTHFGDRKPMGKQSESVSLKTGKQTQAASKSPQERVEEMEKERQEAGLDDKARAVEQARQKQRGANCQTAQTNLELMRTSNRVKVVENGTERYLTPEEVEQKRQEFESIAEENCEPSD